MSDPARWLLLAALALMLASSLYGVGHGRAHDDATRLVLREQYAPAFLAAAAGDRALARERLLDGQARQVAVGRAISVHAHLGKLGVVLLLAGLVLPATGWGGTGRRVLAGCLLAGAALYPLGIQLQIGAADVAVPRGLAAGGAVLVLTGAALLAAGLFRRSQESAGTR